MDIATLGLAVDSRPVTTAAKALDTLADAGKRAEVVTHKVEASFDAEALAAATAKGAVAGLTTALAANSEAQRKEESATRAASQAAKDAVTLRDSHVQAYRNQQAAAEKYLSTLQAEVSEYGKNRSQLEAMRAAQMGLTAEQQKSAAAMGAQLDAMRATAHGASTHLGAVGMSARATAAAMRGVPAQFTDIITSIQGGQAPLTVLLQQGGQLKDMFGGAGNAAKALGGYVVGLVNPFTVATAAALALGVAYHQGSEEGRAFKNAVTMTGDAVGVSNIQFNTMTQSISAIVGTRGKAAEVLTEIASSGRLAGAGVAGIAEAAILMEKATGKAVAKTIEEFIKLADEPAKASATLNKQYNYLTASVYEQIKALEEQGKKTQAAELAEKSYADALGSRAKSVVDNAGLMEKAWRGITGTAKAAWDAMLNAGRPTTATDQIDTLEKQLRDRQERNAGLGIKSGAATQQIIDQIAALKETIRLEQRSAESSAERARINAAGVSAVDAITKANERAASKQEQMNKALREYRAGIEAVRAANPESALLDARRIAAAEAGIRDQFKSPTRPADKPDAFFTAEAKAYTNAMDDLDKIQIRANASAEHLSKTQELLRGIQASPEWAAFSRRKQEEIIMSASLAQVEEDRAAAQKAFEKTRDADIKKTKESTEADVKKAQALEDEIELWGHSEEAIKKLTTARLKDELAVQMSYGDDKAVQAIEDRIAAINRLAVATDKANNLKAADKAAKAAASEWERASNKIENDITNALMRGFESGKGFAENMRDVVVNMFKSMILEPTIRALVAPAVGGATSAAGGGGLIGRAWDWITGGSASGGNADKGVIYGGTGYGTTGAEAAGGGFMSTLGSVGAFAKAALPWIGGLSMIKGLTDYKIDAKGSGITATVGGASGLPSGQVGTFAEFQQTGGLGGGGVTTNRTWGVAEQAVADYVTGNVKAITASNKAYGEALGLTSDKIDSFTKSIEINTTGMDAAAQAAAIDAELTKFSSEQIAAAYGSALAGVAKEGETTAQTLQRLGGDLTGVNAMFRDMGYTLYDVSVTGAAAASTLASAFGGLAAAQSQMGSFYQNFYSQAEQQANTYSTVQADLAKAGFNYSVEDLRAASRADIRATVDALASDTGTEQGAARYAAAVRAANTLSGVKTTTPVVQQVVAAAGGSGGGGGGASSAVNEAQSAAAAILDAWQSVTDGIFDEVDRIRGLMGVGRTGSLSEAQAAFTIANAQANAGDQSAARSLPELSRNVISLATAGAMSLQDLRRIQGQTALALERTGANLNGGYAPTIPQDMLPFVQNGAATTPTVASSAVPNVAGDTVSPTAWAELLAVCKATQENTRKIANLLTGAMPAQTRLQVEVITP